MFKNIYKDKRILITGHTGFKGSWLSIWLKELGAQVTGYSLAPPSEPNNFVSSGLEKKITHIHGNICDLQHLLAVLDEYQPEFIFHLAAQPIVRLSYEEPKMTFDTNIGGTVNVFEAIRMSPCVKVFINVTSDKCYENKEWVWGYRENDPVGGDDPYSASKGCAELIFASYLKSYFSKDLPDARRPGLASVRSGNVIGGGDWGRDRLIPDCVRAIAARQPVGIRNPKAVRPWQHVLEPLSGYLWLGALLWESPAAYSGPWNFGPNDSDSLRVEEVLSKFIEYWGSGEWKDLSTDTKSPHETFILRLCCDKTRLQLGWHCTLKAHEALFITAEWYKLFYSKSRKDNMYQICTDQIKKYVEKANKQGLTWSL